MGHAPPHAIISIYTRNYTTSADANNKLRPIFRDETDIGGTDDLPAHISNALTDSRAMVLICSPEAANSSEVCKEVRQYLALQPRRPIFTLLAPGVTFSEDLKDFVPTPLLDRPWIRSLYISPELEGEKNAFLKIASGLLDVRFGQLSDRIAAYDREVRRQRSRLAAKTHTLPAVEAYQRGDAMTALKHALSAVIEGDDLSWSQAPELEAMCAEFVMRHWDREPLLGPEGDERLRVSEAVMCGTRFIAVGLESGFVLILDAIDGEILAQFNGTDIQEHFERSGSAQTKEKLIWFQSNWHPKRPLGSAVMSPDGAHMILTHWKVATSWRCEDLQPTGIYLSDWYSLFAFSHLGAGVAMGSKEAGTYCRITIANLETGEYLETEDRVWEATAMAFSNLKYRRELLHLVSQDGTIYDIDPKTGAIVARQKLSITRIFNAQFDLSGTAVRVNCSTIGGDEPTFFVRRPEGGWAPADDNVLPSDLSSQNFRIGASAPNGSKFLIWSQNGPCRISDPTTSNVSGPINTSPSYATFAPNGNRLLTHADDQSLHLIDCKSGEIVAHLGHPRHRRQLPTTAKPDDERSRSLWSQDGRRFVTERIRQPQKNPSIEELVATFGGELEPNELDIHEGENGSILMSLTSFGERFSPIGFSPSGEHLWLLKNRHELRCVSVMEPRLKHTWKENAAVEEVAYTPDGHRIAYVKGDLTGRRKEVIIFDTAEGRTIRPISANSDFWKLWFRNNGELVASHGDGTLARYSSRSGILFDSMENSDDYNSEEELFLDYMAAAGGIIVTGTGEDTPAPIVVRDSKSEVWGRVFTSDIVAISALNVASSGKLVAYGELETGVCAVINVENQAVVQSQCRLFLHATAIQIDEARQRCIAVGSTGQTFQFSVRTGECSNLFTFKLFNEEYGLTDAIVLAEQNRIVAAEERLVQIIDLDSQQAVQLGVAGARAVPPIAASPRGELLATGSSDGTVRLWQSDTGNCVASLRHHTQGLTHLSFAPTGDRLLSADATGTLAWWDVSDCYVRSAALTDWVIEQIGEGVLMLDKLDDRNLLLRDVASSMPGTHRDLIKLLKAMRSRSGSRDR